MAYIGNEPSVNFTSFAKQDITGDGTANYTLTYAVANANEIEVFVNNVRQEPTEAYTVSGTALSMTGNVASTDDFYVIYLGKALQTTVPPDASVTNAKIANSTIDLTSKVTGILPVANGGTGLSASVDNITLLNSGGVSVSGNAEVDFFNLPSGVKRIQVNFYGVSGGSDIGALIRLGTSSGLKSSGYSSISHWGTGGNSDGSGFFVYGTGGSNAISGIATINHMGSNAFVSSHSIYYNNSNGAFGGGKVDLGGTLDRLRVQLVSGGNFDAGLININYEL